MVACWCCCSQPLAWTCFTKDKCYLCTHSVNITCIYFIYEILNHINIHNVFLYKRISLTLIKKKSLVPPFKICIQKLSQHCIKKECDALLVQSHFLHRFQQGINDLTFAIQISCIYRKFKLIFHLQMPCRHSPPGHLLVQTHFLQQCWLGIIESNHKSISIIRYM